MDNRKIFPPRKQKQKPLGPAPIASFENTSTDELKYESLDFKMDPSLPDIAEQDSPIKKAIVTAPKESSMKSSVKDATATTTTSSKTLRVSQTPRIDISRASSSSQHEDSRDSSPENVFEQVGTGTLQDSNDENAGDFGFGEEYGANDLRSSTEELYFEDGEKNKVKVEAKEEREWQPMPTSPILFKFDEKHQACLQQNARKDSVNSEVAALLCISGRTSRVSSVGSQGSALSRLSAVSGVSRSPSPHKMLLETSFCGPKSTNRAANSETFAETINTDELEQIILARKQDVTRSVLPEGVNIDLSTPKKSKPEPKTNGVEKIVKRTQIVTDGHTGAAIRGNAHGKKGGVLKKNNQTIVGVTPNGTSYIRIKLKPDDQYDDNGVSSNEKVVENTEVSKPESLSLQTAKRSTARSDVKQSEQLTPKTGRNISGGSRSPSPAIAGGNISRKSSFCSLFRGKDADDECGRDRSRSKSRESDRSGGTPSKQRSILAIFKPRKSSSKSSSPIDPELLRASNEHEQRSRTPTHIEMTQRPGSTTPKLRYYDTPTDGSNVIHIPLRTPPDEKEFKFNAVTTTTQSITKPISNAHIKSAENQTPAPAAMVHITNADITNALAKLKSPKHQAKDKADTGDEKKATKPTITVRASDEKISKPIQPKVDVKPAVKQASPRITNAATKPAKSNKIYQTVLPDGSIHIPLRHSSDEVEEDNDVNHGPLGPTFHQSNGVVKCERMSVPPPPPPPPVQPIQEIVEEPIPPAKPIVEKRIPSNSSIASINPNQSTVPERGSSASSKQTSQDDGNVVSTAAENGSVRAMTKERKRILFTTKIGSGSEEQIFATQLSLSKTDSLSSQLSAEQGALLESPSTDRVTVVQQHTVPEEHQPVVRMRSKEDKICRDTDAAVNSDGKSGRSEVINKNRHSMYIENIDEIMEKQKRLDAEQKQSSSVEKSTADVVKPIKSRQSSGEVSKKESLKEQRVIGSSGSEHDSEADSKHRAVRQIGAVEEESAGLVAQDSYDDDLQYKEDLPFVPTTLPEERSIGVSIIPVRDRVLMDVKTCPVDRPRSTTPMNPSCLEEYCGAAALTDDLDFTITRGEKLRISLPRKDIDKTIVAQKNKSPRRTSNASGKNWFEFAEQGIGGGTLNSPSTSGYNKDTPDEPSSRKPSIQTTEWIDFDSIPEKRKPAKRITTLPYKEPMTEAAHQLQYNYVNPDECQCECHGNERDERGSNDTDSERKKSLAEDQSPDDCVPLLESDPEENLNKMAVTNTGDVCRPMSAELWKKQPFAGEPHSSRRTQSERGRVETNDAESYARTSKTTTVQLPQRLQR